MESAAQILKQYWGYDSFRPLQQEIIGSILARKDTLALLPTGGGKSICYQVPAMLMDGFCLVVSPLIALMQDQVERLAKQEVPAASVHSGMHYNDVRRVLDNAAHGAYKLLYVSPERLQTELFTSYLNSYDISMIAVDEAHCISQWGHDFRPSYLEIATIREYFPGTPVLALTATATPDVQEDIATRLRFSNPAVFKQSFARKNIFYDIRYSENKPADVLNDVNRQCSIIYCRSRRQTEATAKYLLQHGIAATAYHAGMSKERRERAQEQWMYDEAPIISATTAFGMGIDKPGVRMVLHYDAPEHLEAYYQEAGRAGRDGRASIALALYNNADIKRLHESTALKFPPEAFLRKVYQSVAEYLQIPISAQPDKYYPFDVVDFCQKFSLSANETINALKLLEQEGLWTLTEAVYSPATVQFISERHVLDELAQAHPDMGYVTTGLLRMYSTIFHFPTPVRETAVAKTLKMQKAEVIAALQTLDKMQILRYNQPADGPQMFFHHYRVDSRYLVIDLQRIEQLRRRHEARTKTIIGFFENTEVCRERILLAYFGEKPKDDCGHCDICRKQQLTGVSLGNLRSELLLQIKREQPINIQKLVAHYPTDIKERALDVLREMIDEETLHLRENGDLSTLK